MPDSARPGDIFPLSPRSRATFTFGGTRVVGSGVIDAEIGMNAVSTQYLRGDDANAETPLPGYAVWRLRLTYQRPHFAVTGTVRNLFDRELRELRRLRATIPSVRPADRRPTRWSASTRRRSRDRSCSSVTVSR